MKRAKQELEYGWLDIIENMIDDDKREKWGEYDSYFSVSVLCVFTQNYKMHSQALKQDHT